MIVEAVIFDLDGTITDTIPLTVYSLKEVTRELTGKEYKDEEIRKEFGPTDTEIIKKFVDNENRELSPEAYIKHFSDNFNNFVKPIEGIRELLSFIKSKGIKLGLFTGRSHRVTEIILQRLGFKEMFDVIISGDLTRKPKPDPDGILKALDVLEATGRNSIYTGDFDVDIAASKAAGVKSVLALWSSTGEEELIKMNPDMYFISPYEFLHWLKQNRE